MLLLNPDWMRNTCPVSTMPPASPAKAPQSSSAVVPVRHSLTPVRCATVGLSPSRRSRKPQRVRLIRNTTSTARAMLRKKPRLRLKSGGEPSRGSCTSVGSMFDSEEVIEPPTLVSRSSDGLVTAYDTTWKATKVSSSELITTSTRRQYLRNAEMPAQKAPPAALASKVRTTPTPPIPGTFSPTAAPIMAPKMS
jgi:hypothetical protein